MGLDLNSRREDEAQREGAQAGSADLSIVIVSYNSTEVARKCLGSIMAASGRVLVEVIIVNNSPADRQCGELASMDPRVRVIESDANRGFGAGCNVGLEAATGRMILFLNPDVILAPDTLAGMLRFMHERPSCGLACCRIVDEQGRIQRYSLTRAHSLKTSVSDLFFLYKVPLVRRILPGTAYPERLFAGEFAPQAVTGAFMLFRRHVIEQLEGFDERFFLYGEDVDLSVRAAKLADVLYCPEFQCRHVGHSTLGPGFSRVKYTHLYGSRILYLQMHHGTLQAAAFVWLLFACGMVQILPGWVMSLGGAPYVLQRAKFFLDFAGRRLLTRTSGSRLAPDRRQPAR